MDVNVSSTRLQAQTVVDVHRNYETTVVPLAFLLQFPDPNISEADGRTGIAVGLQFDGGAVELFVKGLADVARLALQLKVILDQHSIQQHGDISGTLQRSVGVESGSGPYDIVGLPIAGLAHRVGQRNGLLVNTAGHAVDIGLVVVGVENLQLVSGV